MRPALRQPAILPLLAAILAALAGCAAEDVSGRPPAKPAEFSVAVAKSERTRGEAPLTRARVASKSGELLILGPDGDVSTMQLDSPQGRALLQTTETQLAALRDGKDPIWDGIVAPGARLKGPSAQDQVQAEFAAHSGAALPDWEDGKAKPDPADFLGTRINVIAPDRASDLVEVTARLREGVDADIAFSYATCALAIWARDKGTPFARHIRTTQAQRDGTLLIGAAYMLSEDRPAGLRVMETNDTLRECKDRGIPAT